MYDIINDDEAVDVWYNWWWWCCRCM